MQIPKIDEKDHRSVRKGEWIKASLEKVEQLRPIAERNELNNNRISNEIHHDKERICISVSNSSK